MITRERGGLPCLFSGRLLELVPYYQEVFPHFLELVPVYQETFPLFLELVPLYQETFPHFQPIDLLCDPDSPQ